MEVGGKYIYRGEKYFQVLFYLIYLSLFIFGEEPGDILFYLSIFILFLGYFIKILVRNKTVFHKAPKPEFFYKTSRHPYLFATLIQILPLVVYMKITFSSLIFYFILLFSMYFVLEKSESFYSSIYSAYNIYKNNVPRFFPKMTLDIKELFKRENKNIPLFDRTEILQGLIPILILISLRIDLIEKIESLVKGLL